MRIERRFFEWGIFFIALGAIPLAVQLGWLDRAVVGDAWRLWPVFLIAAGLGIILARSPLHFPGSTGNFGASASVDLTINCGTASLTTAAGAGWTFSGSGAADWRPAVRSSADSLSIANDRGGDLFHFGAARSDWHLQLPTNPNLDLSLTMNAGTARLDLGGARLTDLSLTGNAGSVRIDLSETTSVGSFSATINAGDVLAALPP